MHLLKIKPYDNTFFGTGKVLALGMNNYVESKNIPYPSVFFGAIFSALLSENYKFRKAFFSKSIPDHSKILRIGQVYLYNENDKQVYLPAPKDIFINNSNIRFGKFVEVSNTSLEFPKMLMSPLNSEYKRVDKHFIRVKDLYEGYLRKENNSIKVISEDNIFKKSMKIGIGMNMESRVVEKDMLYKLQHTEFTTNDWSFLVEYELDYDYLKKNYGDINLVYLSQGCLKLGGENKVSKYSEVTNSIIHEFNSFKPKLTNDEFKVIFTSDTYFKDNIDNVFDKYFKIIGISNDKPIYIGGFDMISKNKQGAPKAMHKGYSAGTVLLVKINENLEKYKIVEYLDEIMKLDEDKGFNKYIWMEDL